MWNNQVAFNRLTDFYLWNKFQFWSPICAYLIIANLAIYCHFHILQLLPSDATCMRNLVTRLCYFSKTKSKIFVSCAFWFSCIFGHWEALLSDLRKTSGSIFASTEYLLFIPEKVTYFTSIDWPFKTFKLRKDTALCR